MTCRYNQQGQHLKESMLLIFGFILKDLIWIASVCCIIHVRHISRTRHYSVLGIHQAYSEWITCILEGINDHKTQYSCSTAERGAAICSRRPAGMSR